MLSKHEMAAQMLKTIYPDDLVCMNDYAEQYHFTVDLAYAKADNLLFQEQLYHKNAKLWLYKDLAHIVLKAALLCCQRHAHHFVLYDGLRPVNLQRAMAKTQRARENPHWITENLLSEPGKGGHPRGMAIDIGLLDQNGQTVDMGAPFDYLADHADPQRNPAHRNYKHNQLITHHREMADSCMLDAAAEFKTDLTLLPQEWWDFRLNAAFINQYKPLHDDDLPSHMRMGLDLET